MTEKDDLYLRLRNSPKYAALKGDSLTLTERFDLIEELNLDVLAECAKDYQAKKKAAE